MILPKLASDYDPLISKSAAAKITGVHHHSQLAFEK
jgi:hypothetical protein